MSDLIDRSAALRIIFDSVGKPATEIYQKVREIPPVTAGWIEASALLPPVDREESDEDGRAQISIPVLACLRDGERRIVRRIDEDAAEPGGYEWHGWAREPDDGCAEDVTHWMLLPEPPKEEA